ncbi:MAG: LacI family DNA-binding transcriptional regulator [Azospirillaceae bacterium]
MPEDDATPRVTMQDVALRAGVSQSTVSLVLNGVPGVRIGKETRQRVTDAARDLGYRARRGGGHRRGQRHPFIGLIVDEIATSPFAALSIDGAQEAGWARGRLVLTAKTGGVAEVEAALAEAWRAQGAEGIVYATILTRRVVVPDAVRALPTVLLNCHADDPGLASVVPAETVGGYAATEALIAAGHRRIGFINGEPWMEAARQRRQGYDQALATHDIPADPALAREADFMASGGYRETRALLALDRPPTAIFCANDLMAVGSYEALKEAGLVVGRDVSVIGYDDQEIAKHLSPPLSTVLLPHGDMGRWAVDTLVGQIAGAGSSGAAGSAPALQVKMPCPVVPRDSIGPGPAI